MESVIMLDAALAYAQRELSVFPCHHPIIGAAGASCSCDMPACTSIGKHPRTERGMLDATTDVNAIRAWWRRWPAANIGLVTGSRNKLVVLDIDSPGGEERLAALADQLGDGRDALGGQQQKTGRGRQLLYRYEGDDLRSSAAVFGAGSDVDVRAEGGYVIAAPSLHASGKRYELSDITGPLELEPPLLPSWLANELRTLCAGTAFGVVAPQWQSLIAQGVSEGGRNTTAASLAGYLFSLGFDHPDVLRLVLKFAGNCKPRLPEREARRVVDSIARREAAKPERESSGGLRLPGGKSGSWGGDQTPVEKPWRVFALDELLKEKPPPWVIRGYLRAGQVGVLAAFATVGKSTLAAAWAMSVLYGVPWCGCSVRAGSVLALVGEGRRGFARRLDAFRQYHKLGEMPPGRYCDIVDLHVPLSGASGQKALCDLVADAVAQHGCAPSLILIDTLSSHWGESEDSSEFAAPAIRCLAEVADEHGAAVLLTHHTTKGKGAGTLPGLQDVRGSGVFTFNADAVFTMARDEGGAVLAVLKVKDDEPPAQLGLRLVPHVLFAPVLGNMGEGQSQDAGEDAVTAGVFEAQPKPIGKHGVDEGGRTESERQLLAALDRSPAGEANRLELQQELDWGKTRTGDVLTRLVEKGALVRTGYARKTTYKRPPASRPSAGDPTGGSPT